MRGDTSSECVRDAAVELRGLCHDIGGVAEEKRVICGLDGHTPAKEETRVGDQHCVAVSQGVGAPFAGMSGPAVRAGLMVAGSLPLAAARIAVMGMVQLARAPMVPTVRTARPA